MGAARADAASRAVSMRIPVEGELDDADGRESIRTQFAAAAASLGMLTM
jgi:hypothetical protein